MNQGKTKLAPSVLRIKQEPATPLSKQQKSFNSLVTRIEKLQAKIAATTSGLEHSLHFYAEYLVPVEQRLLQCNNEILTILYEYFKNEKFSKNQRRLLGQLISHLLHGILLETGDEPDDAMKEIFEAVEGVSFKEAASQDLDFLKDGLGSMFETFGVDINMEGFHSEMTEEEMLRKMMEVKEALQRQEEMKFERQKRRKKTKKQLAKEENEIKLQEARSKNIGSIYKQLARAFHPDLEQDMDRKVQKEELMKKLTNAYERKDLHTLLSLELAWIHKEEKNVAALSNEKLAVYNQVLGEQIANLESELFAVYEHPRFQPLLKFVEFPFMLSSLQISRVKKELEQKLQYVSRDLMLLKKPRPNPLNQIKKMISVYKAELKLEEEELFALPF